jgi:hypothetical protein
MHESDFIIFLQVDAKSAACARVLREKKRSTPTMHERLREIESPLVRAKQLIRSFFR